MCSENLNPRTHLATLLKYMRYIVQDLSFGDGDGDEIISAGLRHLIEG